MANLCPSLPRQESAPLPWWQSLLRGIVLACLTTAGLSGQVVSYRVNFSVDETRHGTVFGLSASDTFSVTFSFDLSATPQPISVPQDFLTDGATGTWYLFAVESITEISGSFGTRPFTLQDLQTITLPEFPSEEAELFPTVFIADTDLTTTPSIVKFNYDFTDGSFFNLGSFPSDPDDEGYYLYDAGWTAADLSLDSAASGHVTSIETVSAVPEPSTYAAIAGAGVLGFAVWRRRRANVSRG